MSSTTAANIARVGSRVVPVHKKYTVQSYGIWERIRRIFAVEPARSNGVPLNPQFRNPAPGSNAPFSFIDPVTLPAGDIADNPYWKRDVRRAYPRLSFVSQSDAVALLRLGSQAAPKQELIGDAGSQALAEVQRESEKGLAAYLHAEGTTSSTLSVLGENGLPPLPSRTHLNSDADRYNLTPENAYPEKYPCRTFC
ncbi:hypothetical protein K3495_g5896 [Podosphaera aphanis]|nr:hypothetical protein K3495_g5896 [Podosphaera aphanis]